MDTSKIEGYEQMTPEQKVAALEALEFDTTGYVKKSVFDTTASEAAEWKRKYNSTLSEAEQARIASEEQTKKITDRLAELERNESISKTKDKYIASGFSVDLAQATAEAFVDGNMDVVLANITKHATDVATAARDKALHDTPAPPAGGDGGDINYDEKIRKANEEGDFTSAAYYTRLKHEKK